MPDWSIESQYDGIIAGVDEAGRGPWCGPVVAAAVILPMCAWVEELNDSKKLSEKKRERLFGYITEHADVGVGQASVDEIDQLNILQATKLAMQRAVLNLTTQPTVVLVDGNHGFLINQEVVPVIKG
ncbi:MAG: ribonuclease HII, partial [Phototrophicales bacterium]